MIAPMQTPEVKNIEEGSWVCVAKSVTKLVLHKLSNVPHSPQYYWTYRPAGDTEPPTSLGEHVRWDNPSLPLLDFTAPVHIYIWAQGFPGKIRVDIYL
jgi:hypothetical protein